MVALKWGEGSWERLLGTESTGAVVRTVGQNRKTGGGQRGKPGGGKIGVKLCSQVEDLLRKDTTGLMGKRGGGPAEGPPLTNFPKKGSKGGHGQSLGRGIIRVGTLRVGRPIKRGEIREGYKNLYTSPSMRD